MEIYRKYIKRILDVIISAVTLLLLSPVLLITALLVRVKLGSPVIFKQERPGLNGKIFKMYKFKTMTDERDSEGKLLPDEQRLTHFGNVLRSTSLDELPELWNILKGDMSLIGPRPLLVKYLPLYSERQSHRHDVRPGITGYAQVHGRNKLDWPERFEMDVYYAENLSFKMDLKIVVDTVGVVLRRDGISSDTSATMEEFRG